MSRVCNGEPGLVNVQVEDPRTFDKGVYHAYTEPLIGCGTFSKKICFYDFNYFAD